MEIRDVPSAMAERISALIVWLFEPGTVMCPESLLFFDTAFIIKFSLTCSRVIFNQLFFCYYMFMAKYAIVHVENTQGVVEFAEFLRDSGWKILSAGKTEQLLEKHRIPVIHEVALEEKIFYIQDTAHLVQRVLLARTDSEPDPDFPDAKDDTIPLLCMNLIPFLDPDHKNHRFQSMPVMTSNFLISTILKNSFNNFENLLILTDPADYKDAMVHITTDHIKKEFRLYLAAKALNMVAAFDGGVASSVLRSAPYNEKFLNFITFPFHREMDLHQGMNPQQKASLYRTPVDIGALNGFSKLSGKDISYIMAADATFAWDQINMLYSVLRNQYNVKTENKDGYPFTTQFTPLTGSVFTIAVKMSNILGAGLSTSVLDSFRKTYVYDTQNITDAAFACSAVIDAPAAREIVSCNFSVLIAPDFTAEAKKILSENKKMNLIVSGKSNEIRVDGKLMNGGILLQEKDSALFSHWKIRTKNRPSQMIADEMALGTKIVMSTRSYSDILIKNNAIVGISQGARSEIEALEHVLSDAQRNRADGESLADVLVCDSPVPFCEQITKLIDSGVAAIIQPGGTPSDGQLAEYCDEKNVVMVFTDMTHINF